MNILVIGASGRVGNILVKKLLQKNYHVVGTSRQEKKLFEASNYIQINLDLTENLTDIEGKIPKNLDAVYFVSGSRGENLLQVDLHGAIKTIRIAEKRNIGRFIMLSSIFAIQPEIWENKLPKNLLNYYIAKHYADSWLINNSTLNYTILQPSTLKEETGSGKIAVDVKSFCENSIENVAATLLEVLDNPSAYKKVITMHDGNKPIKEAISEL